MTAHEGNSSDTDPQMAELLGGLETPDHSSDFWTRFDSGLDGESIATVTTLSEREPGAEMGWRGPSTQNGEGSAFRRWGLTALSAAAAVAVVVVGISTFSGRSPAVDSTVVLSEVPVAVEPTVAEEPETDDADVTESTDSQSEEVATAGTPGASGLTTPVATTVPTATPEPEILAAGTDLQSTVPEAEPAERPTGPFSCTTAVGTEDHLNVRVAPNLRAAVLDELAGGSCAIWVIEESVDADWANVRYGQNGERSGWVSAKFLAEVTDPNSAVVDVDGVGGIAWGTPWLEAEEALVVSLGIPDRIGDWVPLCSQGGGESERVLRWSNLSIRFRGVENPQLVAARIDGDGLFSAVNGLSTGLTVAEVREFFPGATTMTLEVDGQWMWRSEAADRAYRPTFSGGFPDAAETPTAQSQIGEIAIGPWQPGC